MKLRELLGLVGVRGRARTYPYEVVTFELPAEGQIQYAQWLHPGETKKVIRQEAVDALRKFVRPGDVAIDIGAHTGDTTIPLGLAVGPQGWVLALEPNRYVFEVLKKNAELNAGKIAIVPLMFAATEESGDFAFEYSDAGFCNGGLHKDINRFRHGHSFPLKVRGENLQAYLATHFAALVPRVRFLKVDAEGYDYYVLKSLKDLIAARKPFIQVEVFKQLRLDQRERLYDFLVGCGYEVYIAQNDSTYLGARLDRRALMEPRHYDVFCVPTR